MCIWRLISLMLLLGGGPAAAFITDVEVSPAEPDFGDPVTITVSGVFTDGCWEVLDSSSSGAGFELAVDIDALDHWEPGVACPTVLVEYTISETYEGLGVGSYTVTVTELHDLVRDPDPDVETVSFEVMDPIPVAEISWAELKVTFR